MAHKKQHNHCRNLLLVSGPSEDINTFKEKAKGRIHEKDEEENLLILDHFRPENVAEYSPMMIIYREMQQRWTGTRWNAYDVTCQEREPKFLQSWNVEEEAQIRNVLDNQNIVPGLVVLIFEFTKEKFQTLEYTFSTAWCPYNIFASNSLSTPFPTLQFDLHYAEQGRAFVGHRRTVKGKTEYNQHYDLSVILNNYHKKHSESEDLQINQTLLHELFPDLNWNLYYPLWDTSG